VSAARGVCISLALLGCGPTLDVGEAGGETTDAPVPAGTTDQPDQPDEPDASTTHMPPSDSSTTDDPTVDDPLVPPEHLSAEGSCQDDGLIFLYFEAFLDLDDSWESQCVPPATITPDQILTIALRDWNGYPAVVEVHPQGQAVASWGDETLEGEITLEVWAPYHPSVLRVNLEASTRTFEGTLDLVLCTYPPDVPCPNGER
jgi:hypothetical protein